MPSVFTTGFRTYSFDRRRSLALFALLTVIAVARSLQHVYVVDVYEPVQYTLWWHIPFNAFMWWNWFLFVPGMYWFAVRLPQGRAALRYWLILCFVLPITIVVIRQGAASLITSLVLADKSDFLGLFYWRLFVNPWMWLDLIVYFAILIGIGVVEYQKRSTQASLKVSRLEMQFAQSQLNALRSQLHPHFLFNTLNTVSTLILKEDNAEAERMLMLLNNFLHTTVFETTRQEVALEEELRFIDDYLAIETVRFSDKLEIRRSVDRGVLDARVPSFLLQPIVENAIYHGIARRTSGGVIHLTARRDGDQLFLSVGDNGPGLGSSPGKKRRRREGVGLTITKERLKHHFGAAFAFALENAESGGAVARITFPLQRHEEKGDRA